MFNTAIIGCGFSGAMVLANLVRHSTHPQSIIIFDRSPAPALGVAYATRSPFHLLNVRAHKMGAFADNERGFIEWLSTGEAHQFCQANHLPLKWQDEDFAPRMLYGAYLTSILKETLILAQQKKIQIEFCNEEAMAIVPEAEFFSVVSSTRTIHTSNIVLATGNRFAPGDHANVGRYVYDVWNFDFSAFALSEEKHERPAVIVGMGLTAIDTVLSLWKGGWKKPIVMVSRRALLPAVHAEYKPALGKIEGTSLLTFVKQLRKAARQEPSWQAVVDSIRSRTLSIWQSFSVAERRYFFRKLFTYWNIHRHRMAPEIGQPLWNAINNGDVLLQQGSIASVEPEAGHVRVQLFSRTNIAPMQAAAVFHCVGPDYRGIVESPLLSHLLASRLLQKSPTGYGILTDEKFVAWQDGYKSIYAMGNYLLGERLETTAVPELRVQAAEIGKNLA
ncbi:MAG: FAD/NAD(P)-binding protein [Rickettsiales bacterium]